MTKTDTNTLVFFLLYFLNLILVACKVTTTHTSGEHNSPVRSANNIKLNINIWNCKVRIRYSICLHCSDYQEIREIFLIYLLIYLPYVHISAIRVEVWLPRSLTHIVGNLTWQLSLIFGMENYIPLLHIHKKNKTSYCLSNQLF